MSKNLLYRTISALVFVPALLYIAAEGRVFFLILVELGIGVGTYEFYEILEARGLHPYKTLGVLAALILGLSTYFRNYLSIFVTFTALLFFLSISELTRKNPDRSIYHISTTVFGIFYVGWLMSHLILLREMPVTLHRNYEIGATYALLPFLLAWSNDTAAYFIGGKLGRRPLIPRVSPKKTWEGTIGGGIFSIIILFVFAKLLFTQWFYYLNVFDCIVLGLLCGVAAPVGDLVESLLKRDALVKDASNTIPGHGGILDRFDSILFCAPIVYYYLRFFAAR